MYHLQPNTTLEGGKNRKLRVSERHKNLFLDVRAEVGYSIELVPGQGGFGIIRQLSLKYKYERN